MFLDPEKARARLESEDNLANRFKKKEEKPPEIQEVTLHRPGKDRPNLTREERTEIATRAKLGENQQRLADEFGTTQENVSQIKNRKNQKNIDEDKVESTITQVRDKALDRLMSSLGLLTDDKLSGCSAKDLSVIAANMGRVVDKTLPKSDSPDKINLIIFSPELRQEKSFKVVEV